MTAASFRFARAVIRVCAIAGALAIGVAGCMPPPPPKPVPPPPVAEQAPPPTTAGHPLTGEEPGFLRLPNMAQGRTPVRVGVLLPFSNGSAATRALAKSLMNAAQLAMFDARNPDVLLITADEGSSPQDAAAAARGLLAQGAEIIVGPLFAPSVTAVAPIARDRGVPVVAFSTDRNVAGNGVYLLSFQPENDVKRVVSYAVAHGHTTFAALIPRTAYGDRIASALKAEAEADKVQLADIERFDPGAADLSAPARAAAASNADAILIAQGGTPLRSIAAMLGSTGADRARFKLLGTGLWDDKTLTRETMLEGGWFAAPPPNVDETFAAKYRAVFGTSPPQLAALAYDAVSLVALLSPGTAYHRFTAQALTDPNGFAGVSGIFRFNPDGTSERGLAILSVEPDGFRIVDPAPRTFQAQPS